MCENVDIAKKLEPKKFKQKIDEVCGGHASDIHGWFDAFDEDHDGHINLRHTVLLSAPYMIFFQFSAVPPRAAVLVPRPIFILGAIAPSFGIWGL